MLDEQSVSRGVHAAANAQIEQDNREDLELEHAFARQSLVSAAGYHISGPYEGSENPIVDESLSADYEESAEQFVRSYERANPGLSSTELYTKFQHESKPVQRAEAVTDYGSVDAQIQQAIAVSRASRAAEKTQAVAISSSQQTQFVSPARTQQLARETPKVERDFGLSL